MNNVMNNRLKRARENIEAHFISNDLNPKHPILTKLTHLIRDIEVTSATPGTGLHSDSLYLVHFSECLEILRSKCESQDANRLIVDLRNIHQFESTYGELVACASYLRKGATAKIHPNQVQGGKNINEFDVDINGKIVPIEVKTVRSKDLEQEPLAKSLRQEVLTKCKSLNATGKLTILTKVYLTDAIIGEIMHLLDEVVSKNQTIVSFSRSRFASIRYRRRLSATELSLKIIPHYAQDKYRAIRDNVRKAHDEQLPDGLAGVVHVFLPPDLAYDVFASLEASYQYIYENLLKDKPKLGLLVFECVSVGNHLLAGIHQRYLAPNPECQFSLPVGLDLSFADHTIEPWNAVSNMFSLGFSLELQPFGSNRPLKDHEIVWISSPLGDTQIRVFIRPTGNLRVDLLTRMGGRAVLEIDNSKCSIEGLHQYRFEFSGRPTIDVYLDEKAVDPSHYKLISRTKLPFPNQSLDHDATTGDSFSTDTWLY